MISILSFSKECLWLRRRLVPHMLMDGCQSYITRTSVWFVVLILALMGKLSSEFIFPAYLLIDLASWRVALFLFYAVSTTSESYTSMKRVQVNREPSTCSAHTCTCASCLSCIRVHKTAHSNQK